MALSDILKERGFAYQFSTEKLEDITDGPKRTLYLGVDPTASSMHAGQLQGMLVLRRFVDDGHKLIIVVGGGTGMIGDPGGKSAERNLLADETVDANAAALKAQFQRLLGDVEFEMVNNAEWLRNLNYMEFLRDIGKHFTVNEMIKRDSVRPRLETPEQSISYTEFSYMLLQAYDFLELHTRYGCDLQVGGSDQWGNIISGVDLIRRKAGHQAFAFSWPLLVDKKTGRKFGKSEGNAVWLDETKTSVFAFYQFWMNIDDDMLADLLLKLTLIPKAEIDAVLHAHAADPSLRVGQKKLADAVTALVHGPDATDRVRRISAALFSTKPDGLSEDDITMLAAQAPSCAVTIGEPLVDVIVRSGLSASKREARQFVEDGGVYLNGAKISDTNRSVMREDFQNASIAILKWGKRNVCVLIQS